MIWLIASLALLAGCATDISRFRIRDAALRIGNQGQSLVPGNTHPVQVSFRVGEGEDERNITNVDWESLEIRMLNHPGRFPRPFQLKVPDFRFALLQQPWYDILLAIPENSYPPREYRYSVRWDLGNILVFQGNAGNNGNTGSHGGFGAPGPQITVEVSYYDVSGLGLEGGPYLLIHSPNSRRTALVDVRHAPFRIAATGGTGGRGGSGYSRNSTQGQDVYGEPGLSGGDGGPGGSILFLYPEGQDEIRNYFMLDVGGGFGGEGGGGGRGDTAVQPRGGEAVLRALFGVNHGPMGPPGRQGSYGNVNYQARPQGQLFLSYRDPDFQRERLGVVGTSYVSSPETEKD